MTGLPYLHVSHLEGVETLGELYSYTLTLKTRDEYNPLDVGAPGSALNLQSLIGSTVSIKIELDGKISLAGALDNAFGVDIERMAGGLLHSNLGAGVRYITGIVSQAAYVGVEGNYAVYRVMLKPAQFLLTKRSDYRVFQHQTTPAIIRTVLDMLNYPYEFRLTGNYETNDYTTIFGETYWDFICRIAQDVGIYWFWEHGLNTHKMVLCDSLAAHKPNSSAAYHTVFCYPPDLKIAEEYISSFEPEQSLTSGKVYLKNYQFKSPRADQTSTAAQPWDTAHNELEVYEFEYGNYVDSANGGDSKARIRAEALRQHGHRAAGSGNLRGLQCGHTFDLMNHPADASNRGWLLLSTFISASEIGEETGAGEYSFNCSFVVQPNNELFRPERTAVTPSAQLQSATVVGPAGQEVWTDQYGRVKVQFHWDRLGTSDENSSCWLRVSSPWAGMNYGGIQIPRIGQEVIVSFLNEHPDMPFVSGRLTNPDHMPLWDLPSQHVLSGFKSKEIDAGRNNHLIMDDTPAEVQVQLTSDESMSQLNLGYVTRVPAPSGRADYRGQGAELRTDAWGAIRAANGLALTTYSRSGGSSYIKDLAESIALLKQGHSQQEALTQAAIEHKADERALADTAHVQLAAQVKAIKGESGGSDKFGELSEPHLLLSSPAGIALTTPKSIHAAANVHVALTSGKDTSMSIGAKLAASVGKGVSWFTQSKGIRMFAAKDKIEIQAQSDDLDIIAHQVFKIVSAKKSIEFAAAKEILLTAGGSYIKINGAGIEHGTPAIWRVWAGDHSKVGPKSVNYKTPISFEAFKRVGHLLDKTSQEPVIGLRYKLTHKGKTITGRTDDDGQTDWMTSAKSEKAKIEFFDQDQIIIG